MPRELLHFGPFALKTFGLTIALGVLAGLAVSLSEARRKKINGDRVMELVLLLLVVGIVGARIGFMVIEDPGYYIQNPLEALKISEGGLSIHGALLGGLLAALWYTRRHGLPFWKLADILAPGLALGQAIGRIGCDVFGKPMATAWPWGVAVEGALLHPVQVYEFLLDFALFYFLWSRRGRTRYDGQLFIIFLVIFNLVRGTVEFFRINPVVFEPFTVAHVTSAFFILAALLVDRLFLCRRARRAGGEGRVVRRPFLELGAVIAMAGIGLFVFYTFS